MSMIASRRQFLKSASSLAALGPLASYWVTDKPAGAASFQAKNDRPIIGVVGPGGRGLGVARGALRFGDVAAVCDPDLVRAEKAKATLGGKAAVFQDYRKMLDASGNRRGHQRHPSTGTRRSTSLPPGGQGLYTESPHPDDRRGQDSARVVEETGRIVHVGTQHMSESWFRTACELVRNGRVGAQASHRAAAALSRQGRAVSHGARSADARLGHLAGSGARTPLLPPALHFSWRFGRNGGGKV